MRAVIALAALALLAACGTEQTSSPAVIEGQPVAEPYDGPMSAAPDFSDNASPIQRSGAAGQALECDGEVFDGGGGDYADSGLESVQSSPERALQNWIEQEGGFHPIPGTGYRIEREDDDRVLLSYDVDGQTKVAFIAADGVHDWNDDTGWGVESWSQCDPAELPAEIAEAVGLGVWTDASGKRVPVSEIRSYQGPEHCDWQDITFLHIGPEGDHDEYVRDAGGELSELLTSTYKSGVRLPDDATDSGYQRNGQELWLVPNQQAAYLVRSDSPKDVERWPASKETIGCA